MRKSDVPLIFVDVSMKLLKVYYIVFVVWLCSLLGSGVKARVFQCAKECSNGWKVCGLGNKISTPQLTSLVTWGKWFDLTEFPYLQNEDNSNLQGCCDLVGMKYLIGLQHNGCHTVSLANICFHHLVPTPLPLAYCGYILNTSNHHFCVRTGRNFKSSLLRILPSPFIFNLLVY